MSAIASSRINKSGKKFAPKAPTRRAAVGQTKQDAESAANGNVTPAEPAKSFTTDELPPTNVAQEQVQVAVNTLTAETNIPAIIQPIESSTQIEADAVAIPIPAPVPPASKPTVPVVRATRHAAEPSKLTLAAAEFPNRTVTEDGQAMGTAEGLVKDRGQKRRPATSTVDALTNEPRKKRQRTYAQKSSGKDQDLPPESIGSPSLQDTSDRHTRSSRGTRGASKNEDNVAVGREQNVQKPSRKAQSKKSLEEVASEIVAEATQEGKAENKKGRRRQKTPEQAEEHEITTSAVRMADLTKDSKLGKKSQRETMLQNTNWDEVRRKRKELEEARMAGNPKDTGFDQVIQPTGPKMVVINGNITAQVGSEFVDTTNGAFDDQNAVAPINEDDIVKRVTTASLGRKPNRLGSGKWDEAMTALFYRGLRMFGTDFMMISQMFPGLSRSNVKAKFVKEERTNPGLIKETLLGPREKVDMEEFSRMTNTVYKDVKDFKKELEEESKKVEADVAREEAEKNNQLDASTVLGEGDTVRGDLDGSRSLKENRFNAIADAIVNDATAGGRKGKRRSMPKKNVVRNKHLAGGEARILGPVNES